METDYENLSIRVKDLVDYIKDDNSKLSLIIFLKEFCINKLDFQSAVVLREKEKKMRVELYDNK